MSRNKVYIGGDWYPHSYLKYRRSGLDLGSQEIRVDIPSIESIAPGSVVEIKRNDVTVTKGICTRRAWKVGREVSTIVQALCYRRKWELLPGVLTAPDTEAGTHFENQLPDTGMTKGTYNTYGAITVDYGAGTQSYFERWIAMADVLYMTGWEFNMLPGGSTNFKSQCGSDKSSLVRFSRIEGTLIDWTDDYVEDGLLKLEKITVIGKGIGAYQAYASAQTGGYSAGDPEKTYTKPTLVSDTLCGTAAAALLADMQANVKYGVFRGINPYDGRAFDVFDTIKIVDEDLAVSESLRVAEMTVEETESEGEIFTITVTNITKLQTAGPMLIGFVRSRIEDDYARTKQIADLDEIDDGSEYGKIKVVGMTSGQIKAAGCITGFGTKAGGSEVQAIGDDVWEAGDLPATVVWTSPTYPAIDGVKYILTNWEIDIKVKQYEDPDEDVFARVYYSIAGGAWTQFGAVTTNQLTWQHETSNPTDVETANNQSLQLRLEAWGGPSGEGIICQTRRLIILMAAKNYRRDI